MAAAGKPDDGGGEEPGGGGEPGGYPGPNTSWNMSTVNAGPAIAYIQVAILLVGHQGNRFSRLRSNPPVAGEFRGGGGIRGGARC